MSLKGKFSEEDLKKVTEYLNFIASKAKFSDMGVGDNIEFFKLLAYMQQELLPKIKENILEVRAVHEEKSEE